MKKLSFVIATFLLKMSVFASFPLLYTAPATVPNGQELASSPAISTTAYEHELIRRVQVSVANAREGISNLNNDVLKIPGMSSSKNRHLLNNLCSYAGTRYLEIGCWQGSTFISALFNNNASVVSATGMDNWIEFGGPYQQFQDHCDKFIHDVPYQFYSHDCFSIDPKTFITDKINVYFYDGRHERQDQSKAFTYFNEILEEVFIAIVDDWNHQPAREGTFDAFKELGYTVLYETGLPAKFNGDVEGWWNGFYVAVIRK